MFKQWQKRVLNAAAVHIIPRGGLIEFGAEDVGYIAFTERFLSLAPIEVGLLFKALIFFLEFSPFLSILTFKRFTKLSPSDQDRMLRKWKNSSIYILRNIFMVFSMPFQMAFYSDPHVLDAIGYKGYKPGVRKILI